MSETPCPPVIKFCRRVCGVSISIGLLLALGILAFIAYVLIFSETVRQNGPLTVERARQIGCPIPLPETASNVRFNVYHHFGDDEVYVKFKDDATVCQRWVKTVVEANAKEHKGASTHAKLERITSPPPDPAWGGLGPISWFNISRIVDGVIRTSSGPNDPTIWIDDDRGLFYYRLTD